MLLMVLLVLAAAALVILPLRNSHPTNEFCKVEYIECKAKAPDDYHG